MDDINVENQSNSVNEELLDELHVALATYSESALADENHLRKLKTEDTNYDNLHATFIDCQNDVRSLADNLVEKGLSTSNQEDYINKLQTGF